MSRKAWVGGLQRIPVQKSNFFRWKCGPWHFLTRHQHIAQKISAEQSSENRYLVFRSTNLQRETTQIVMFIPLCNLDPNAANLQWFSKHEKVGAVPVERSSWGLFSLLELFETKLDKALDCIFTESARCPFARGGRDTNPLVWPNPQNHCQPATHKL